MAAQQPQQAGVVARRARRRFVLTEVALMGGLYGLYTLARDMAMHNLDRATDFAHQLVALERLLAIAIEPQVNHWVDARAWIAVPLCFWYASLHYLVTPFVLVLVARKRPDLYGSARTSVVLATLVALALYWTLPTTPPRLLGDGQYVDTMQHYASWGWWGNQGSAPGPASWTNEYAAFPSMHAGWATWVAIQLTRMYPRRWPAVAGWLYLMGTAFVVIGTGNHYVIDVIAGVLIVVMCHLVSLRIPSRYLMLGTWESQALVDLRIAAAADTVSGTHRWNRRGGPVDLRTPRQRELDRFLAGLSTSVEPDRQREGRGQDPPRA
ncbi:MAG TPA: phosphatase PAP2 family protein [Actinomycetes bacterium]|nr:phosphatase PAP2 family protein [Actinomycetes bacterium]